MLWKYLEVCIDRVGLRGFLNSNYHGGLKKTQPNPTHYRGPTQPKPRGLGWTVFLITIIIIIKLNIIKTPLQIRANI